MSLESYLTDKDRSYAKKSTNINDLLNRAKFERKKEKRATYIISISSASVLIIFALVVLLWNES